MSTQYRFKTVMVNDSDRDAFTALRDSFGDVRVTDKELFQVIFQLIDKEKVCFVVKGVKAKQHEQRELDKIKKLEQKLKDKLEKLQATTEQPKKKKVS